MVLYAWILMRVKEGWAREIARFARAASNPADLLINRADVVTGEWDVVVPVTTTGTGALPQERLERFVLSLGSQASIVQTLTLPVLDRDTRARWHANYPPGALNSDLRAWVLVTTDRRQATNVKARLRGGLGMPPQDPMGPPPPRAATARVRLVETLAGPYDLMVGLREPDGPTLEDRIVQDVQIVGVSGHSTETLIITSTTDSTDPNATPDDPWPWEPVPPPPPPPPPSP
jgi:hypothetical protein